MELNGCNDHFIDSNVVLGFVIGWDSLRDKSSSYFDLEDIIRYSSERVYEECEIVLNNIKRWILLFIYKIHKYCEKNLLPILSLIYREF
jgi:predicted nucleic acid-binding protein